MGLLETMQLRVDWQRRYSEQTITGTDNADDSVSGKYTCSSRIPAA